MNDILKVLQKEFGLKQYQVENTAKLIDDGNTIPFIARYRKEATGELNDQVLRDFYERLIYLRTLEQKKEDTKRLIDEQQKLTDEIIKAIDAATTLQEIEDIYRPFRPKRRTRATIAREKGLEEFAKILMEQNIFSGTIDEIASKYVNKEKDVNSIEEALNGAMDIIAEEMSDNAAFRKVIRDMIFKHGIIITKAKKQEETSVYTMYNDFSEPVQKIAKHRVLAINRGEKEDYLQVKIDVPKDFAVEYLKSITIKKKNAISAKYLEMTIVDSYDRLIFPSLEREVRNVLTEYAEEQSIKVFSENLKHLLLQPPLRNSVILGLDPAYRTGCKIAVVDETGKVLDTTVVYPTPPQNKTQEAKVTLKNLIEKYNVDIISIGNGTASKESEIFVAELLKEIDKKVSYMVVSESGASVYSASKLGAQEFPDFDVSLRSAVSIARRLQDPLAELVKIDPKAIGVGQYQHDMNQKRLDEGLGGVVEYCVNSVGVELNTASSSLLCYISGINSSISKNIIDYREKNGKFKSRKELLKVKKLGERTFKQCAGFLRIIDGELILDNTSVHPESYDAALKLLETMGLTLNDVIQRKIEKLNTFVNQSNFEKIASEIGIGVPTLRDIVNELSKPGRDPRDELPKPILLTDVISMEDLKIGMILTGTVRNVADFGAFVDIGVHQDGLVHISELSDRFIRNAMDVVAVGDIVKVKVIGVDVQRKRINLSMKEMRKAIGVDQ